VLGAAIFDVQGVGELIGDFQGRIDLPVPEVPLGVLQHCFQVGAQIRLVRFPDAFGYAAHPGQPHGYVYRKNSINLTLRLTTMAQQAKGVQAEGYPEFGADLEEMLEHPKWNLWHGKVDRALEIVDELACALEVEDHRCASPEHRKLLKAVRAFEAYVTNNRAAIPNYGERYRQGKTISTAFVESAVNQVVSKRFVKKQQMRWTPAGAHLLLQIRVQVLNQTWRGTLSRWYPGINAPPQLQAGDRAKPGATGRVLYSGKVF
jgi:hypothetical protein